MEYTTGTIRQTVARLHREGMNVTENSLRVWVRTGVLPAAFCGKKAYIYYPNVLKLLTEGVPPQQQTEPVAVSGIRRINQ